MLSDVSAPDFGKVLVTRGQGLDAWHVVSVAVVDVSGKLLRHAGDPHLVTFARSAIKAFQALPLIASGAADRFGVCDQELALAQASHNGTDEHVQWVKSLLHKANASAQELRCGAHLPFFMHYDKRWPQHGEDEDPLRHNCSGKHAGFLLVARHLAIEPERYLDPANALQVAVGDALADHAGLARDALLLGTDGCSAPNYGLPLSGLALAFARYARAEATSPLGRLKQALLRHPQLVSGEGQFDLELMRAFNGQIVCKGGAEAILAIGVIDSGLGIVLKVHDGNSRALAPACLAVLEQLGLFPGGVPPSLAPFVRPVVRNARGIATGELIAELRLV